MNILVIAPHPDDELLGCAGTISKHVCHNDKVFVCIVTKGYAPDFKDELIVRGIMEDDEANEFLGVEHVYHLSFPASGLDGWNKSQINDEIYKIIKETKAEEIYIPFYGDVHLDHKIVCQSALVAARPKPESTVKRIYCYEVMSETGWEIPDNTFKPNVYVDISDYISDKRTALGYMKSQIKEYPHARSVDSVTSLASYRGTMIGVPYAEAFILVREIK